MYVSYSSISMKHMRNLTLSHSCRQTYTPIHKPLHRCLLCWVQEWVELMWNVWFSAWLWSRHTAVPTCAAKRSMSTISGLCQTESAAGNLGNLSNAAPLVAVPPCPARPQPVLCLYKDMGAGHPSLTEKKENKDEIQVRSHPETCRQGLACEHRPPQRWGYFCNCRGFLRWIYITGIPLMSALKRDFSSCLKETL